MSTVVNNEAPDLKGADFHYFYRRTSWTITGAAVTSQEVDGEEVDALAVRVVAYGDRRDDRRPQTFVLPMDTLLAQSLLEKMREEQGA